MDKDLKELVRRFFLGEISFSQYRNARGRLIDTVAGTAADNTASGITAPHPRAAAVAPPPPRAPVVMTPRPAPVIAAPRPQTLADTESQTQMRPRRAPPVVKAAPVSVKAVPVRRAWLIGAGILTLLGVVSGMLVLGHRSPTPGQAPALAVAAQVTPGQKLLAAFVSANDWSAGGIAGFSQGWDALDPTERQTARHTPEFQRLADALYQRIAEQRALEDAAGTTPSQSKRVISAFARYLSIDYGSLQASTAVSTSPAPAAQASADKPAEQTAKVDKLSVPTPTATPPPDTAPPIEKSTATEPPAANVAAVAGVAATKSEAGTAGSDGACRVALLGTRRPFCNDQIAQGVDGPLLVVIPGGEFQMGSSQTAEEQPPHPVRIARPFAMSVHEISVAEFLRFCRATQSTCPSERWPADDYPVVNVNWSDAEAYVRWLSQATGHRYRLPSEAEWEYAARAGSTSAYPGGDELLITDARFSAQRPETAPLPNSDHSINRNRFRLANMAGNVREWVQDAWQNTYLGAPVDGTARAGGAGERVVRGGSYADPAVQLRSSARMHLPAESRDAVTGFRVVRQLGE